MSRKRTTTRMGGNTTLPAPVESFIVTLRDERVILDSDLARIYGVTTGALNRAVKRNRERFPEDFVFELTAEESLVLRCQSGISKMEPSAGGPGRGGRRYLPYAFTEHGAVMVANVLQSPRAVEMSVFVVRAFIRLRRSLAGYPAISRRLDDLEKKYDAQFKVVFDAIRALMAAPEPRRRAIGFRVEEGRPAYRARRPRRQSAANG